LEAVVLAGGKGTRLRQLTADLPKPLVPIGKHPIIEILISRLASAGVSRVHMAVSHLADKIEAVVGDGSRFGLKIIYSREEEPLSTIGPLRIFPRIS
jgi:NDP-sugar pyrophosphorylase family protein